MTALRPVSLLAALLRPRDGAAAIPRLTLRVTCLSPDGKTVNTHTIRLPGDTPLAALRRACRPLLPHGHRPIAWALDDTPRNL